MPNNAISSPELKLITSAGKYYESLFEDISRARTSVFVMMYIIEPGKAASEFQSCLAAAARKGLDVMLMYDSVGCFQMPASYFKKLSDTGALISEFRPVDPRRVKGPFSLPLLFHRNHRKMAIIDNNIYYVGGMNIGDRFLDWADVMARGKGDPARELSDVFMRIWRNDTREFLAIKRACFDHCVQVFDSRPKLQNYPLKRLYISAVKKSKKRVWIAQAYFIPRRKLAKALIRSAQRGVDTRIYVPDVSDVRMVDLASWKVIAKLVKRGVHVFRYEPAMLHSKMALIDDNWLTVGTANLDSMSMYWNQEINLVIRESGAMRRAEEVFAEYESHSRRVTLEELVSRPIPARIMGWFLGKYLSWIL